jgi:hypothetical protein
MNYVDATRIHKGFGVGRVRKRRRVGGGQPTRYNAR